MHKTDGFRIVDATNSTYYPTSGDPWETSSSDDEFRYVEFFDSKMGETYFKKYRASNAAPNRCQDDRYECKCKETQIRKRDSKIRKNWARTLLAANLQRGKMDPQRLDKSEHESKYGDGKKIADDGFVIPVDGYA